MPTFPASIKVCPPAADVFEFGSVTLDGSAPLLPSSVRADGTVTGLFASWKIAAEFVNSSGAEADGVYVLPLPSRFAVRDATVTVDGRVITATLRERGEARAVYEAAVAEGRTAALVEEDRPELFTVSVGSVKPAAVISVELALMGPVAVVDGRARLRLPTVAAQRYTDRSNPERDAHRIDPVKMEASASVPFLFSLSVNSEDRPSVPEGFSAVGTSRQWTVSSRRAAAPSGDVHVTFDAPVWAPGSAPSAVIVSDATAGVPAAAGSDTDATVAVSLLAPVDTAVAERDVVVVLDRSGSMLGAPIEVARRAAARLVDSLSDRDRFAVLTFDTVIEAPWEGLRPASDENRFAAVRFLSATDARGGTDLTAALSAALESLSSDDGRERSVVLVTDALVSDEDSALRALSAGVRVFGVSVGSFPNAGLLDRLADRSGGVSQVVPDAAALDSALDGLRRRLNPPVFSDVAVAVDGVPLADVAVRHADAHAGVPLVVSGRASFTARVAKVTARDRSGSTLCWEVPLVLSANPAVHATWARAQVANLCEDRLLSSEADPVPSVGTIVDFSTRHRVLCRYTAFVAVDESGDELDAAPAAPEPSGFGMLRSGPVARGFVVGSAPSRTGAAVSNVAAGPIGAKSFSAADAVFDTVTVSYTTVGDLSLPQPPTTPQPGVDVSELTALLGRVVTSDPDLFTAGLARDAALALLTAAAADSGLPVDVVRVCADVLSALEVFDSAAASAAATRALELFSAYRSQVGPGPVPPSPSGPFWDPR